MKTILAKKIGMTRVFTDKGKAEAVTVVEAGPCNVIQLNNEEKNGYNSIQIGYGDKKYLNKPSLGHIKNAKKENDKIKNVSFLKEVRVNKDEIANLKIGDELKTDMFKPGDTVSVSGVSKGKGFQGTVKRHHFHTGPKSHGSDNYRQPGSIGATFPQRTLKGKRMAGHMGAENITTFGLEIIDIIPEKNIILIKGAVPGAKNSIITVKGVEND
jgi:large subunit ribosomal protein L3